MGNLFQRLQVCDETPVELIVNGKKLTTFMCTPKDLKDLALGHLYNRGLVKEIREVLTLTATDDIRKIYVKLTHDLPQEQYSLARILASGCGSSVVFDEQLLATTPVQSMVKVSIAELKSLARSMFASATLYQETGGVHCAAIAKPGHLLAVREDVGRHNAVDKVVGKALMTEIDFSECVVLTSGRISSDMALKALAARIPVVVSRSIPSSLALEIADKMGITLVGRIATQQPIIYSHGYRINNNSQL